eukprot:TRINITY_DN406_c0_g1_i5.p1 TRINITY_DN406_c0_g1~~TRINITY_DN406_c0_g1_i5.p1  ORF type:complete len:246 (+),score=60.15 TRINITY_DN406_c0_g1_i5:44-781(+)
MRWTWVALLSLTLALALLSAPSSCAAAAEGVENVNANPALVVGAAADANASAIFVTFGGATGSGGFYLDKYDAAGIKKLWSVDVSTTYNGFTLAANGWFAEASTGAIYLAQGGPGYVLKLDIETGKKIWQVEIFKAFYESYYAPTAIRPSPDGELLVWFSGFFLAKVAKSDGKTLWMVDIYGTSGSACYAANSFAAAGDSVYVTQGPSAGHIIQLRLSDGEQVAYVQSSEMLLGATYFPNAIQLV